MNIWEAKAPAPYASATESSPDAVQRRLSEWSQPMLTDTTVVMFGAGGIGSAVARSLALLGVGVLKLVDFDSVETTNLARGEFGPADVGEPKVKAVVEHLANSTAMGSSLFGYECDAADFLSSFEQPFDLAVIGTDSMSSRMHVSEWCGEYGVPLVSIGLDERGEGFEVLVQRDDGPCLACFYGDVLTEGPTPCARIGAAHDGLIRQAAGVGIDAIVSLLMPGRPLQWNRFNLRARECRLVVPMESRREGCRQCG